MHRLVFVFFTLLLFVFASVSQAQEEGAWPLTPEEIFGPDVRVEYKTYFAPQLTDPAWLDEVRVLNIDGHLYRYLDTFEQITEIVPFDENRFLIGNVIKGQPSEIYEFWFFDRQTHEISRFESACHDTNDELRLMPSALIEFFQWTIITDSKTSRWCNRFTGELSDPLPDGYQWLIDNFGLGSRGPRLLYTLSPDKRYIAFVAQVGPASQSIFSREMELFSYDTVERRLMSLGKFHGETLIALTEWADNQILVKSGETCSICQQTVFIADASRPASLETAFTYHFNTPVYDEDQARYIFGARNPLSAECGETIYDVATRTLTRRELGGCRPDFGSIDGVSYYRNVPMMPSSVCCERFPEEIPTVPVIRWDARTGESKVMYEGEIEEVRWVSSDDRYAIMLRDTNGRIDSVPYNFMYGARGITFLELIDLETQTVLWSQQSYLDNRYFELGPISDRDFLKIECSARSTACQSWVWTHPVWLYIDDQGVLQEQNLPHKLVIGLTPDHSGILYWINPSPYTIHSDEVSDLNGIWFYDFETGEMQVLVNPLDPELYKTTVYNLNEEELIVRVTRVSRPDQYNSYTVRFESGQPTVIISQFVPAVAANACLLEANVDADLHDMPSQTVTDSVQKGQMLLADGQAVSDGLTWWRLAEGNWIQSDFTDELGICESLPVVDPTLNEDRIPVLQIAQ